METDDLIKECAEDLIEKPLFPSHELYFLVFLEIFPFTYRDLKENSSHPTGLKFPA